MEKKNRSNSSYFSNDSSWFSPDYSTPKETFSNRNNPSSKKIKNSNLNKNQKIRFRGLSGTYTSDTQESSISTSSIIWDGVGIGQSIIKYEAEVTDLLVDVENTMIDLSYTFGDEYTFTLGISSVYSGELIGTTSDGQIYNSEKVFGYGAFSIYGIEFGIFEILLGYKYIKYAYIDLESESTALYWSNFNDSGGLYVTGIGIAF
jgi:hypothetical protein|tara:strand:+ start:368 stop:979 length:612 start_codon:yes stop_codon:yes gene_type:complete